MARLYPFRALRYNTTQVNLADVVTQPYDKITTEMQDAYYAASPYNLVRVILGKRHAEDPDAENVYTRAAATLHDWRADGILKEEAEPAIYGYSQTYTVPGTTEVRTRRGFIALGQLYDYADKVIFRHEQTFPKHKSDRLALFKATRAYCEQIYMLYSDPALAAEHLLFDDADGTEKPADLEVTDEYGVQHRVWKLTDPELIGKLLKTMADKELIIADGHHRYETSTTYMHERAAELGLNESRLEPRQEGGLPVPSFPEVAMMMTFVNMDAPGITILPTHRVLFGLTDFNAQDFAAKAVDYFNVAALPRPDTEDDATAAARLLAKLEATPGIAFIAATQNADYLLIPSAMKSAQLLQGISPRQAALDVTVLHKIIIERLLGLSEETVRAGENIRYYREAEQCFTEVRSGKRDIAFLTKPVTLEQMKDISLNMEVMPQKSTDFYPKLLSGLAMYTLD